MEIKVINEKQNVVLRVPVNHPDLNNSVNQKVPLLNTSALKSNTSLNESLKLNQQGEKFTLQDLDEESEYTPDYGINSARSEIVTNNIYDQRKDSLNQSIQYAKYNQKENIPSHYQSMSRLSFNRNASTADMSRATRNLKSQALEKSCVSSQSLETNAIFSLDHVLPSSNVETNRFMATEFVELNFINKDFILKDLKNLKQNREKYEDYIFISDEHALVNNANTSQYKEWTEEFIWKRIKDLYPRYKYQLLSTLSCQTLIKPGAVEIPYLISVLNILKDYPNRIMNILENQTLNDTCLYYVRLCLDGVWKYISVDDNIPCVRKSKVSKIEPAFLDLSPISLQSHDVWPHLLMKAYAKYLGTYEVLLQGNVEETLRDFTGAPIERVHSSEQILTQIITQALDRKFIVLAQPYAELDQEQYENLGIKANNSYPITNILLLYGESVFEIKDFLGTCTWNDTSLFENYKDEDLRVLQIGMKQNVFYMRQSDFQKIFGSVSICKCNETFYYNAIPVRHAKNKYSARKFTLKQQSLCYFELTQKDKRLYRNSAYNYIQGRILVLKKQDRDNFEFVDGVWDQQRNISLELNLDEGEYYIISILDYERNIVDVALSYYGDQPIVWQKVNFNKEQNVLEKAMQQLCYDSGQKKDLNADVQLIQILDEKVGLIACFYENINSYDSQNVKIDLDLDEEKLIPLNAPSQNEIHLKPLSNEIFIWKIRNFENM